MKFIKGLVCYYLVEHSIPFASSVFQGFDLCDIIEKQAHNSFLLFISEQNSKFRS